ncbi:MAG TPA: hypothetical protein VM802_24415 [Chitinophaga sp.]|uniref:hypothetical protein n=1 Tax=Chitinophaga sp. TaxID=1869181 RepID=UPI002BFAA9A2|nr:hypothetical protein [Chitinophaga sp.]HVI48035.1 hypothetical protein [Chitinophaga sp.]
MKTLNVEKFETLSSDELIQTNGGGLISDLLKDTIAGVTLLFGDIVTVAVNVVLNAAFNITSLLSGIKLPA